MKDAVDDRVPQDKEQIVVQYRLAMIIIELSPSRSQRIRRLHWNPDPLARNVYHGWPELRVNTTEMSQETMNLETVFMVKRALVS